MKNYYQFCSICGSKLKLKDRNLACVSCSFVNYRNPRPTVTALVLYKSKFLLVKRSNSPYYGWWDLPGGFVDKGESPEKTVERELREEFGLRVKKKKLVGTYTGTYSDQSGSCYILTLVYIVSPVSPNIRPVAKDEISSLRWFFKKELPKKIAFDSNRKIIKDFMKVWK